MCTACDAGTYSGFPGMYDTIIAAAGYIMSRGIWETTWGRLRIWDIIERVFCLASLMPVAIQILKISSRFELSWAIWVSLRLILPWANQWPLFVKARNKLVSVAGESSPLCKDIVVECVFYLDFPIRRHVLYKVQRRIILWLNRRAYEPNFYYNNGKSYLLVLCTRSMYFEWVACARISYIQGWAIE